VVERGAAGDPGTEHRHWRAAIGRAILTATAPADPGPVQVDISFREPLVPDEGDEEYQLDASVGTAFDAVPPAESDLTGGRDAGGDPAGQAGGDAAGRAGGGAGGAGDDHDDDDTAR